jgi:lipopolysaccharide transport system permease protein
VDAAEVALRDFGGALRHFPLALRLALDDIQGKYQRTVLGPLWIVIGQAATVAAFGVVFSGLFRMDPETYVLYLAAGLPTWSLLASHLNEMPSAFIVDRGMIETYEIPWTTYVWRRSFGYILVFGHQILTLFVVMALLNHMPTVEMLYVLPALVIVNVAGVGVGLVLAVMGARYRDLQPAMGVVTGFLFLFSPVVWRPEQLEQNYWAVQFNPMYYFVKLVRDPLMGQPPEPSLLIATGLGAAALFGLGFIVFMLSRPRLYHWL